MGSGESRMGPSNGKRLNVRWLHKCARMAYLGARRGATGKKQCRFGGGMLRMWSVGCGMGHAAREYFSHGSQIDTDAIRTACQ